MDEFNVRHRGGTYMYEESIVGRAASMKGRAKHKPECSVALPVSCVLYIVPHGVDAVDSVAAYDEGDDGHGEYGKARSATFHGCRRDQERGAGVEGPWNGRRVAGGIGGVGDVGEGVHEGVLGLCWS